MGGMSGMPSMGGMSSLGTDDMMGQMMSNMNMKSSSSIMMSSSSSTISSSSSSSKMMSSNIGGMSLPPMRGMEMPEEMSSLPPSSQPSTAPEYTVTSPPMSPPPEMYHKVQKTADYTPPTTESADTTVLLKFKEGSDYKLALNMQQFSPDDITIKLNGNELIIEAATS